MPRLPAGRLKRFVLQDKPALRAVKCMAKEPARRRLYKEEEERRSGGDDE